MGVLVEGTSQQGALSSEQRRALESGSWGAAIGFIYLISMKAHTHALIAFIGSLIPIVNLVVWIYYIMKGKQLAWQFRAWKGFDDFLTCQRIWDRWAKWLFAIGLVLGVLGGFLSGGQF